MIYYIYGDELDDFPDLRDGMFRDRARQFKERLGWSVEVDALGCEHDEYDALNPLYIIAPSTDGGHGGSMRFLPTTGPVMVNEHFSHLNNDVKLVSPLVWECTRFCLSPQDHVPKRTAARLMLAAAVMGQRFRLSHAVGVFDAPMQRVYRALGWAPDILGRSGVGRDAISVGLWAFDNAPLSRLGSRAEVPLSVAECWRIPR